MDVLMVASELAPVARVGGLGDAVAALAKTLCRLEHAVTVALPRYREVEQAGLMLARRLSRVRLGAAEATLYDARLSSGVELVLVDVPELFDRAGIYGAEGRDHADNARRFGIFCRAVVEIVARRAERGRPFDVVHAHDWPAALVPLLLRDGPPGGAARPRTVLTVHDAAHQGVFPREALADVGLDARPAHAVELEAHGALNLLKGGILAADAVTTVSPSYARELTRPGGAAGLEEVFRARERVLTGIANGIDYATWSPATDPHLCARYDAEDVANKGRCKAAALGELELSIDPERPLVVALGRLDHAHGTDVLARAAGGIVRTGAQLVVAGEGDAELSDALERSLARLREDARFLGRVSDATAHRLVAAADAVVIPARREPCGQLQLCAQRYGAPPVAHRTGGLADTIVDADAKLETGTGFLFDAATPEALLGAVERAVAAMGSPRWGVLRRRCMRVDVSWERPARRYARLYSATAESAA
jgi:starch synthase